MQREETMMSKKRQSVLIGTTLNPAGDKVVASGIRLARSMGAKVHLVHAYDLPRIPGGVPSILDVPVGERLDSGRRALVERMDLQIARLGLRPEEIASTTLHLGAAHRVLIETARRSGADLIVIGAAESDEARTRLIGSTADRVVRKTDRPVLLVRDELTVPLTRVLLPVGLSAFAAEALEEGLELLGGMAGGRETELEALFVSAEVDGRAARGQSIPDPARAVATGRLDSFLAGPRSTAGRRIASRVEFGFIDREILTRIERWRPDLVVLRSHERSGVEPFLLGRVTMALLRQGDACVLVIPPLAARAGMGAGKVETMEEVEVAPEVLAHVDPVGGSTIRWRTA
jgi:nucleotide-binding universal stress UspA family protein